MVRRDTARVVVAGLLVASATTLAAQQTRSERMTAEAQIQQRRFQFQLMESVLVNAVRQGASETVMRAQMTMPIGTLLVGEPRAKGFPLDGYGVLFDVEIPIILESQVLLSQMTPTAPPSPVGPGNRPVSGSGTPTRATGVVPDDPTVMSPVVEDPFLRDPSAFYRNVVRDRLIDVMLEYSQKLAVPDEEWLSVVARSEEDPSRRLQNDSRTMILRIKGSDLSAMFSGRITREEAKKRVVESQF